MLVINFILGTVLSAIMIIGMSFGYEWFVPSNPLWYDTSTWDEHTKHVVFGIVMFLSPLLGAMYSHWRNIQ